MGTQFENFKAITDGQSLELSKTVKFLKIGLEMRTGRPDSHKYLIHPYSFQFQ